MTTLYDGGPVMGGTFPALIWASVISAWQEIKAERAAEKASGEHNKSAGPGVEGEYVPEESTSEEYVPEESEESAPAEPEEEAAPEPEAAEPAPEAAPEAAPAGAGGGGGVTAG